MGIKQLIKKQASRTARGPWLLLVATAALMLIVLPLLQKGTFIDGMLYKAVGFNYYAGLSGFWKMKFTDTCMSFFCEQPPLFFWLLGWYYKIAGSGHLADRLFTLLQLITLLLLILSACRSLLHSPYDHFLLLVAMLTSIPVFCWSYANQVIEPLVCVWTLLAMLAFVQFLRRPSPVWILLFAAALVLAFLSKGFQSCYFIALPAVYFLLKPGKRTLVFTVASALSAGMLALPFLLYAPAIEWFSCYYEARLLLTMQNVGATTDQHSEIIVRYFTELAGPLLILCALFVFLWSRYRYPVRLAFRNFLRNKLALSLLLASFTGAFPFALSLVQRGFYLLPAFLFFVFAIVLGFKRYWLLLFAAMRGAGRSVVFRGAMILFFSAGILFFALTVNDYKRDQALLDDLRVIAPYLRNSETLSIEEGLWNYTSLHAALYMEKQVSLSAAHDKNADKILRDAASPAPEGNFRKIPGTNQLSLYIRR